MAKVGAQRAAELTGKSKSTIQRAMKSGKISFEHDKNGRRTVDVAELERAFGLIPQESEKNDRDAIEAELEKAAQMLETERLKMRIKMLEEQLSSAEEMIEDLKRQREEWQKQAQQTLLTSQYTQKQAEDLQAQLAERERRAREKRQQAMERRMQAMQNMKGENQNAKTSDDKKGESSSFDIQNLWTKLKDSKKKMAS